MSPRSRIWKNRVRRAVVAGGPNEVGTETWEWGSTPRSKTAAAEDEERAVGARRWRQTPFVLLAGQPKHLGRVNLTGRSADEAHLLELLLAGPREACCQIPSRGS